MAKKAGYREVKEVARKYAEELRRRGITVKEIILYGSYASGKQGRDSDIDLVVISPGLAKMEPISRMEFLAKATVGFKESIEVLGYTPRELRRNRDSIFGEIITKTGKVLYKGK